jgi:hypothetical protein
MKEAEIAITTAIFDARTKGQDISRPVLDLEYEIAKLLALHVLMGLEAYGLEVVRKPTMPRPLTGG